MAARTRTTAFDPSDPANMTAEERVRELAAILATGMLRMRRGAATPAPGAQTSSVQESGQIGLDDCPETSPHGHRG